MYRKTAMLLALVLLLWGAETSLTTGQQKDDPKPPDKMLEGVWEMISLVRNGKAVEPEKEGKHLSTFHGTTFSAKIGSNEIGRANLKIDPSRMPKEIDFSPLVGPNQGKTALGIYEIKGDELRLCNSEPGKDRPSEFSAKEGSFHSLRTYKRYKP